MDNKIGYIINESGILMEDFDIVTPTASGATPFKDDIKFHSKDRVIGYGILQAADERNRNGRIYRRSDLEREVNAPRQRELMDSGTFLGHAGHPLSSELIVQQTIDPKLCCVRFHKLWMEGDKVMAYFEGTNNELGKTFDSDLRIGVKPAFSLRALGTIKATPQGAMVENLKMITYDSVIYPSHRGAYTQGVISESAIENAPVSGFALNESNDATKSFITSFSNADVVKAIKQMGATNESAIDYIKDKSHNFKMLKEYFDLSKYDTIDIINPRQVALTEAGNATIVMNIEDYIAKELQGYKG